MDTISIQDFRKHIWFPIRNFIRSHKLDEEIDLIAYSSDFPYAVNFTSDLKAAKLKRNKFRGNIASLTSMTYFAHRVEINDIGYLGKNHYFRDFSGPKIKTLPPSSTSSAKLDKKEIKRLKTIAKKHINDKNSTTRAEISYQKIVESEPEIPENWYHLAQSQAAIQKWDMAIKSLTMAVDLGWTNSLFTVRDTYFKPLHKNSRFQELLNRMKTAYGPFLLTSGFRHHYTWSNADLAYLNPSDKLDQYYLSTMLAYTGERGNSFSEIMSYLNSATASDASQPDGTVYLLENSNVRSKTRQHLFPTTIIELTRRNQKVEVLHKGMDNQNGIIPISRSDVIGAVVGFDKFKWDKSNSSLLPGAIAESLTSYGGHFNKAKQTKLTEFLRHGAAGSSGAVAEPYSFQEKFPVPLIHAWYADGCSLAESFYQSIELPYQLIIIGDPLARPFASFADINLKSPKMNEPWSDIVEINVEVQPAQGKTIKKIEFWVDGQYQFDTPVNKPFLWDTQSVEDGSHEIRLIAIEDSHIETRSSKVLNPQVFNHQHRLHINPFNRAVTYKDTIEMTGTAMEAKKVELVHGNTIISEASVKNSHWKLSVPASVFGVGPVSYYIRSIYKNESGVRSAPVKLKIGIPEAIEPILKEKPSGNGLNALVYDQKNTEHHMVVNQLKGQLQFKELRKKKLTARQLKLDGFFYVDTDGFYQLAIATQGVLKVSINNQLLLDKTINRHDGDSFIPMHIKHGWHQLEIDLEIFGRRPILKAVLAGEQPPMMLAGKILGHSTPKIKN